MEFVWQQSRGEALYVEQEEKRIYGFIFWRDGNRLNIGAMGISSKAAHEFIPLGKFIDEKAAKVAVEESVAKLFHPSHELVGQNAKAVAASLTGGLEKQVVKR